MKFNMIDMLMSIIIILIINVDSINLRLLFD